MTSVAFSPDGMLAVSGSLDGEGSLDRMARIWDAATGTERVALTGNYGSVHDVAFIPGTSLVLTASRDPDVRAWDAASGARRALLKSGSAVNALAVSPDGTLVAATTTITARTWQTATGEPGHTVSGGHDHLTAVAFAPSGALLGHRVHRQDGDHLGCRDRCPGADPDGTRELSHRGRVPPRASARCGRDRLA